MRRVCDTFDTGRMPGNDRRVDPCRRRRVAKAQEAVGREEELRDRAGRPGIELALQIVEVGLRAIGVGMRFGIGGDRDFERRDCLQPGDQLDRIGIALRMRAIRRSAGNVAAQRDDVPHPGLPIGLRHLVDLGARCLDAGQVRGGRHGAFGGDARDGRVGAFARRSAGAIGDRHEARRQAAPACGTCPTAALPSSRSWAGKIRS